MLIAIASKSTLLILEFTAVIIWKLKYHENIKIETLFYVSDYKWKAGKLLNSVAVFILPK